MAYLNHLYSVPSEHLACCTSWKVIQTSSTKVVSCSHLIGYWPEYEPLRNALGQALDGGRGLSDGWRHQLRAPTVHASEAVLETLVLLEEAWARAKAEYGELAADDWWRIEIEKCLGLFRHAADHREAVVSILEQSMFIDEPDATNKSRPRMIFLERWLPWLTSQG